MRVSRILKRVGSSTCPLPPNSKMPLMPHTRTPHVEAHQGLAPAQYSAPGGACPQFDGTAEALHFQCVVTLPEGPGRPATAASKAALSSSPSAAISDA